ncbi:MAG: hypothetical protein IKE33_05555 [Erysipelotrichaceae bacterium]|nr:hypothetical protein [Erysipelotrichaceae bacterium]
MKEYFTCSLIKNGLLGGALIVEDKTITFKTNKLTVNKKYRLLELNRDDIVDLSWKQSVFPTAVFKMKDGESYSFLIFNKKRFIDVYNR